MEANNVMGAAIVSVAVLIAAYDLASSILERISSSKRYFNVMLPTSAL